MLYSYSSSAPESLKATQYWFAHIITQPFQMNAQLPDLSPSGEPIANEAAKYIVPSKLKSHERIQLYYQQYWWRLINVMQESFPFLLRLFGYAGFNETLAVPYLVKHPPKDWSLNNLGSNLPQWIKAHYLEPDQKFVFDVAELDQAFVDCFVAGSKQAIEAQKIIQDGGTDALLTLKLTLQPHLRLFSWDYDLFSYRQLFIEKEPEYWEKHEFPELPKDRPYSFVFFRGTGNNLFWREITPTQVWLLRFFQRGATIEEACQAIENENEEMYTEIAQNLQKWFQEWSALKWLVAYEKIT